MSLILKRAALLLILGTLCACGAAPPVTERGAVAPTTRIEVVESARVQRGPVRGVVMTSGSIAARRSTPIGPAIAGRILHIFVNVGQEVPFGAPLFQIDPEPYAIAMRDAEAGLALARAQVEEANEDELRLRALAKREMASPQEHRRMRTRAAVARAHLQQAEARVAAVKADLLRTLVLSPYAGSIVERFAHEGLMATVRPNTHVVQLLESSVLEALLDVPEAVPIAVRPGDPVRLWVEGHPVPLDSEVLAVSREIDRRTRTYAVRVPVQDPAGTIKSGAFVRAEIQPTPRENALLVDRLAVSRDEGRSFVFRVIEGAAQRHPVKLGVIGREHVEVLTGLAEGDEVVIGAAVSRIADGTHVRSAELDSQAPSALVSAQPPEPAGSTGDEPETVAP